MPDINITITDANPINITIGETVDRITYLAEDEKLRFDGATGDTYFVYNSSLARLELFKDGTLKAAW